MSNERPRQSIAVILPVSSTYMATSRIRDIAHGLDNVGIDLSTIEISVPPDVIADLQLLPTKEGIFFWNVDGATIKLRQQENPK